MATASIPGTSTAASGQAPPQQAKASSAETSTAQKTAEQPTQQGQDTVKLSGKALAHSLKQQGQTVAQIARAMHLDVKTVDSYLGISDKSASAAAAVAQTPQPTTAAEEAKEPAAVKTKEAASGKG
ncbi:MAG TPA: hypothetical protein VJ955_07160 [Desulfuromonadales bacterium]|nr:hypothetical protein [Desulfuromonadales bacterium]